MKTIGLIGGMSWNSSIEYYRLINEMIQKRLGGAHSAKCMMYSVDFEEYVELKQKKDWETMKNELVRISQVLKNAGCDFIVICTNTMHKMAPDIEKEVNIEVLHIADATGKEIKKQDLKKVALLGTQYTMLGDFYKKRIKEIFNIDVVIPNDADIKIINDVIYDELVKGIIKEESKRKFKEIIKKLEVKGAEGVILGCTEIPLLIKQKDLDIPVFSTTEIHAKEIVNFALGVDKYV